MIVYLYLLCFLLCFFSLRDAIFAFFVILVVLKTFAKVTQLNLLINIEYLFFEKVKPSMLMTKVLIQFYIFTYFLTGICPYILYFWYHI